MPSNPSFKPSIKRTASGRVLYRLTIPARFSGNGKRKDMYYTTKAAAEADAVVLRESMRQGTIGLLSLLTPEQARQAVGAFQRLDGSRLSLLEAVDIALAQREVLARRVTVGELLERYGTEVGESRRWSVSTRQGWRKAARPLLEAHGGELLGEVTPELMRSWLEAASSSASMFNASCRTLSGAWSWAVKQGLASVNVFERIERKAVERTDDVDIFTPAEARALLDACRDYTAEGELDCTDCVLAFAVLLFAGVRPAEFSRLAWRDVQPQADGSLLLFVGGSKAKTKTSRFVHVRPNLRAFLDAWQGERKGKLAPPNWERKAKLVRARSGFSARKDTARHSFASYALAAGEPLDAVKADMGHAHGSNVLFTNYRAAATPAAAREYWSITANTIAGPSARRQPKAARRATR